jgi:WD40 repeat protein
VSAVSFASDGKTGLVGSSEGHLQIWDIKTGGQLRSYRLEIAIESAALSPDGRAVLVGGRERNSNVPTLGLLDLSNGGILRRFVGHRSSANSVAFIQGGRLALSGSENEPGLILWNIATGKPEKIFEGATGIKALAIMPDETSVLTVGSGPPLQLWDIVNGKITKTFGKSNEGLYLPMKVPQDRYLIVTGSDRSLNLWDLRTGHFVRVASGHTGEITTLMSTKNFPILGSVSDDGLKIWQVPTLASKRTLRAKQEIASSGAISPDSKRAIVSEEDGTINLWDVPSGKLLKIFKTRNLVRTPGAPEWALTNYVTVAFSADSKFAVAGYQDGKVAVLNLEAFKLERSLRGHSSDIICVAVSLDRKYILSVSRNELILWDFLSGRELRRQTTSSAITCPLIFLNDMKNVISGESLWERSQAVLRVWDFKSGTLIARFGSTLVGSMGSFDSLEVSADEAFAYSRHQDGAIRIWDLRSRALFAILQTGENANDWLVVDPSGRFDSGALDNGAPFSWVVSDDTFNPLPPEIFMRDYFEPRLLPRLLACHEAEKARPGACAREFKPVRPLASLNRSQPEVKIVSVEPEARAADEVVVTVEVRGVERSYGAAGQAKTWQSGVYDLRLFRDGQLVGQGPDVREPEPLEALEPEADVARWREAHRLIDGVGVKQHTFRQVRLPRHEQGSTIEFSAYAFNADRVKSTTARLSYTVPQNLPARERRAYVVAVGVSAYEDRVWDLRYADDDARRMVQVLTPRLEATGRYKEVVPVLLLADWEERDRVRTVTAATATKQNVKAVLDILAGRDVPEDVRRALPNEARLQRAQPDDLVLIAYSSHGYADRAGNFYLFPYDIGSDTRKVVSADVLKRAISSSELSVWLRDIDAGELIMVVDACHSAASVESPEFKPGPMGARGLGQLAYDKGMRVLASTRADDVAWESARTRQGLLSYALVHDGLEQGKADFRPADGSIGIQEWLEYAVQRVPQLYAEALGSAGAGRTAAAKGKPAKRTAPGKTAGEGRLVIVDSASRSARYITRPGASAATQQPSLFSYKRGNDTTLIPATR